MARDLVEVLEQILKLVPTADRWHELHLQLEDVKRSAEFGAPETQTHFWQLAGEALQDEIGPPPWSEPWMQKVASVFADRELTPEELGPEPDPEDISIPLSWVCPACGREGDLKMLLMERDGRPICDDTECEAFVEATGYVTLDGAGQVHISEDWVNASGYPDEGFVYIVCGTCGEYNDLRSWSVKAYRSWERAKVHAVSAMLRAFELYQQHCQKAWRHGGHLRWVGGESEVPRDANEFDPEMQTDYTGTEYFVEPVPLADE